MKRILSNRVFMLVTLGFCFEITIISGFMTFLPKYIEHQFDVDNSLANIYTGNKKKTNRDTFFLTFKTIKIIFFYLNF